MNEALRQILSRRPAFTPAALFAQYDADGLWIPSLTPRTLANGLANAYDRDAGNSLSGSPGQVPAVNDSDPIGVVLGESENAALGADIGPALSSLELNNPSDTWEDLGGGIWRFTDNVGGQNKPGVGTDSGFILVDDRQYYVLGFEITAANGTARIGISSGVGAPGVGVKVYELVGVGRFNGNGPFDIRVEDASSEIGDTFSIRDNISFRPIAGDHAKQRTAASHPTLVDDAGPNSDLWAAQGDGVGGHFTTALPPTASCALAIYVEANAVSDAFMGASVGTDFIKLVTHSDGKLRAYVGSTTVDVTAASIVDVPGVAWLTVDDDAGTFAAGWIPASGGSAEQVTGQAYSGDVPTTQPIYLLAENDDGSPVTPMDGEGLAFFAIQAAIAVAEMTATGKYMLAHAGR